MLRFNCFSAGSSKIRTLSMFNRHEVVMNEHKKRETIDITFLTLKKIVAAFIFALHSL